LAHLSVAEYLTSSRLKDSRISDFHMEMDQVHFQLAKLCIQYLALEDFAGHKSKVLPLNARLGKYRLLRYAACYWADHLKASNVDEETFKSAFKDELSWFLQPDHYGGRYENWQEVYLTGPGREQTKRPPLHYAIEFGIIPLVDALFPVLGIDSHFEEGASPLHVAASCGNLYVVNRILESGVDVDYIRSSDLKALTAMQCAAEHGHFEVVETLLIAGARPSATSPSGTTAFWRAARAGSVEIMQLLKDAGSDINQRSWDDWAPIHEAIRCGNPDAVNKLLEWEADQSFPSKNSEQRKDHEMQHRFELMNDVLVQSKSYMANEGSLKFPTVAEAWKSLDHLGRQNEPVASCGHLWRCCQCYEANNPALSPKGCFVCGHFICFSCEASGSLPGTTVKTADGRDTKELETELTLRRMYERHLMIYEESNCD
jgi:hypothetical protein